MKSVQHSQRESTASPIQKSSKKGFTVGPANLPDGIYRRKVQKIKSNLIQKAKLKKSYAKLKEREPLPPPSTSTYYTQADPDAPTPNLDLHPARQAMLDAPETATLTYQNTASINHSTPIPWGKPHSQKSKPIPFEKEARAAKQRREEAEARRKQIEEANRQRQVKIEERERFRRAMAKARTGGKNGQRKLGRESKVLLEKVQRLVGE